MEASEKFDATSVHASLNAAEEKYHETFKDHVPAEVHRFDSFLATVRMVVDQSVTNARQEEN